MQRSIAIVTMILLFSTTISAQTSDNYSEDWYKVESFEIEGLPKSALEIVEKIYQKAKKDKNNPQLVKTLLYKSKFALTLEEEAQLEIINRLKQESNNLQSPAKNLLESIIADVYWQYFQQNRWKFYDRTTTSEKVDSTDFRTWDLHTIFEETHHHYQESLKGSISLQETDLSPFNSILDLQENSKNYRPTLYDFLAYRAIDFYKTDERNLKRPAYKFEIDNPKLLTSNTDFVKNQLYAEDSLSQQLHALRLYKNLTLSHLKDKDPTALVALTLDRLDFVKSNAVFNEVDSMYLQTLKTLKANYKDNEVVTEIDYKIALLYNEQANKFKPLESSEYQWKRKEALEICKIAITDYPKSSGAEKCKSLQSEILNPSLQITTEKIVPIHKPARLLVTYKNTDHLYFTAFIISKGQERKFNEIYEESKRIEFIQKLRAVKTWNTQLKNESDYQQHINEVLLPELGAHSYMIFASTDESISEENTYGYTFVQVSDFALIENTNSGKNIYQVVDRNNGKPIENATVNIKNYNTSRYNKLIDKTLITDKNGQVSFRIDTYRNNVVVTVKSKNDEAVFGEYYLYENQDRAVTENKSARIFLFTDRSIYRPGQTVYFKGIAVASENDKSSAIADKEVSVYLQDVNYQQVKTVTFKTNEFGSFSGEFILPNTGLTGNFNILASSSYIFGNQLNGSTYFSVEEYKRPKFETEFKPVTETYKVNDSIIVNGVATAFAGSNITEAKVVYRVIRTAQFPRWYWHDRNSGFNSESLEITHGETTTDDSGNFKIKFKAIPDPSIKQEAQPTFNYMVYADITDINGETRSTATNVNVGYHALSVNISIADKLDKLKKDHNITLATNNLNGEFVPTKGSIKIYKTQAPDYTLRARPWKHPDYQSFSKEEFKKLFPHEAYQNESDPTNWEKGKIVFETNYDTEKSKEIVLKNIEKWQSGNYIIVGESKDKFGQLVKDEQRFDAYSDNDKTVADNQLLFIKTDKDSYNPSEFIKLKVGSASENLYLTISIYKKYKLVDTKIVQLSNEIKTINIPVNKEDLGGFSIQYQWVNYNSFSNGTLNIKVPYPKHELAIETSTFRDKLQPGQNETWSFRIKGTQKDKIAAEVLASMYDASLDQFRPHNWYFNPVYRPSYYSYDRSTANHSFGNTTFNIYQKNYIHYGFSRQQYDQLNWFGFSLTNSWFNNSYLNSIKRKRLPDSITSYSDTKKEKGYIYGKVSDESGVLPGVNVMVKGSTRGAVTDFDGNFKIKAAEGETLVFAFIGYVTNEIKLKKDNTYNIVLRADAQTLDEVVITGYGTQRREKKSIVGALTGQVAGVQIVEDEAEVAEMEMDGASLAKEAPEGIPTPPVTEFPLKGIVARKNLQETAFFYPHLKTDADGNVSFNFTVPESLTRWNLNLLAHTKELTVAQTQLNTVTQKELMVMPNPPRFLREGDKIVFATKISNLTENTLDGISELQLFDALTDKPIDAKLGNADNRKTFTVNAKGNTNVSWILQIPFDVQAVKYKIVAKAGEFTDGEENVLPVMSNRMLVTETLPMWLRSNETKTFTLDKLKNNTSTTLKHHNLSLEITSNPVWYAIQALPYLMEYPYECSEQTFARYYSNALASHIANSNPRIQEVFNQWATSDALLSNLEKNQELKSLIIEETPWLRDAQSETEQKKRIALLFDLNKMKNELATAIRKLEQAQMSNGGFPWFKGARYPNRYITQHIASGFGHLSKLGVANSDAQQMINKAVSFLDDEILSDFNELKKTANRIRKEAKTKLEGERLEKEFWMSNHTHHFQIQYLYMRSFYKELPIAKNVQVAVDYFTNQSYEFWIDNNLYTKGMVSLIAKRNGKTAVADKIIASLKENAVRNEELGMYWKENTSSWYWYQAPIETQALLIEAFTEIIGDNKTIDELKVWLLKNKQTNRWNTTKATTEAVYALLLQGTDWLEVTEFVGITIGNKKIDPLQLEDTKVEAGTGYFKTSWKGDEIKNEMATVTLSKKNEGVAWGALYWQYFEDLDKITSAETPLKLSKKLFLKKNTDKGEELTVITESADLILGDLVRVRIELKVDRTMEFVHMKDMRAAGFEPVNVLSQYKWQDNLGYYESTKDAATNFFFDYLPKGVYVFEYDLRVNNKGDFSNGITTIQSMYAPEFSSHSEGVRVKIE